MTCTLKITIVAGNLETMKQYSRSALRQINDATRFDDLQMYRGSGDKAHCTMEIEIDTTARIKQLRDEADKLEKLLEGGTTP